MEARPVTEWEMFDEFIVFLVLMVTCWIVMTLYDRVAGAYPKNDMFRSLRGPSDRKGFLYRSCVWGMIFGFCGCTGILFIWAW